MKKTLAIFLLLLSLNAFAQNKATVMILQDARLAVLGDNKGNEAFTTNIKIASEWQGNQLKHGYFFGRPEIEYADLQIQYFRTSLNFGFKHNQFSKYFDLAYSVGYGMIGRKYDKNWFGTQQFGADIFFYFKLNDTVNLIANSQIVDRNDLEKRKFVYSKFIGFQIIF